MNEISLPNEVVNIDVARNLCDSGFRINNSTVSVLIDEVEYCRSLIGKLIANRRRAMDEAIVYAQNVDICLPINYLTNKKGRG